MLRALLVSVVAVFALVACGGSRAAAKKKTAPTAVEAETPKPKPKVASSCTEDARTTDKREADVDGDGIPDMFKYYQEIDDPEKPGERKTVLVRQDVDLNWDARLDLCRYFDTAGNAIKEEMDLDYDGRVDEVRTYEDGVIVLAQRDRNNDGTFDVTRRYKGGKLIQKETDTNNDGKVDRWEYFDGQKLDRIGIDLDHDGKVDRWAKSSK